LTRFGGPCLIALSARYPTLVGVLQRRHPPVWRFRRDGRRLEHVRPHLRQRRGAWAHLQQL